MIENVGKNRLNLYFNFLIFLYILFVHENHDMTVEYIICLSMLIIPLGIVVIEKFCIRKCWMCYA